jgi:phenylalanyl-tRNA synthetase beta chain
VKIPLRWLREVVETDLDPAALKERLVQAGIEVASITPVVEGLRGAVVGQIERVERELEPRGPDHWLRVLRVATTGGAFSVLCGAPNAVAGMRSAFAPPGATLPGGRRIEKATIRGVTSEGMLCSERELGLGDDGAGILELPADAPLGEDLTRYLGLDDVVLEIEITPNRPDALSVLGLGREVSALTGARLRPPAVAVVERGPAIDAQASVVIEDADLCPRYDARVIRGLTVRPSPPWLAQRLRAAGLRPINNVVDVTNYVMWELGQPLHAFDLATIPGGRVVVRRARPGERITTLDGKERALPTETLAICDASRPIGIGGVMGGADTEVTASTSAVLLEAAYFHPPSIRRTARALGLHSDAAYRFERGTDIDGLRRALDRAAALMAELGGGEVSPGVIDVYPVPRPLRQIDLRMERVDRLIGASPPRAEAVAILRRLGFEVDDAGGALRVKVPHFRPDVVQEDDLVEEVVRVWGYDRIPLTLGGSPPQSVVRRPRGLALWQAVGRAFTGAGLAEVITYSFVDPDRLARLGLAGQGLPLDNPLARDRSVLRPVLVPGLLEVVATNATRQMPDVQIFEIGQVFAPHRPADDDRPAHEELWLGLALTGARAPRAWHTQASPVDVHDAKGLVTLALSAAGAPAFEIEPLAPGQGPAYLEVGRGARVLVDRQPVGWVGEVSLAAREAFDLSAPVFLAELSLSALAVRAPAVPRHQALARFPAVQRDLAMVVPAEVSAAEVESAIRALDVPWLTRVALFDVYTGAQVGAGRRSLGWGLTFQAPDRTLTDAEVNAAHTRVVEALARRFGGEVRGS